MKLHIATILFLLISSLSFGQALVGNDLRVYTAAGTEVFDVDHVNTEIDIENSYTLNANVASANIWVGDALGRSVVVAVTGDISISNAGVVDISAITGDFTVDTPTFFVESATDRIGVGTLNPMDDLTAGDTDLSSEGVHIFSSTNAALVIEGGLTARLDLIDVGATDDEEWLSILTNGGVTIITTPTNAGVTSTNVLTIEHSSSFVSFGSNQDPDTIIDIDGAFTFRELSANPTAPDEGSAVIWMSDGTALGDDGDVIIASTAGGTTNYLIFFDHSAGTIYP